MKKYLSISKPFLWSIVLIFLLLPLACSKFEYRVINEPAYLRVFNNLDYVVTLENKDQPLPYLTMLIDPQFDSSGLPIGAAITGDFLDSRKPYTPPYPTYTGNVSASNYEYPGNADVLVAPVKNGFNLASWAQIPSGKHRILFVLRPRTATPFALLEARFRKQITVDTTINLETKELYTLHVIQKDFETKENMAYLRKENFYKQAFDNDRVYVNFYNLSSTGFWQAPENQKPLISFRNRGTAHGIQDEMNIYCSLYDGIIEQGVFNPPPTGSIVTGYKNLLWGTLTRNLTDTSVHPYYSFPLFLNKQPGEVQSKLVPAFTFAIPGLDPANIGAGDVRTKIMGVVGIATQNSFDILTYNNHFMGDQSIYNLIVTTHSGKNMSQSFATVNTVEVVNGKVYLTTIQRTFLPPEY